MRGLAGAGPGAAAAVENLDGALQEEAGSMSWCPGSQGRRGALSQAPSLGAPMKMDTRDVAKGLASPDAWQGPPGAWRAAPELRAWLSLDLELSLLFCNQFRKRPF